MMEEELRANLEDKTIMMAELQTAGEMADELFNRLKDSEIASINVLARKTKEELQEMGFSDDDYNKIHEALKNAQEVWKRNAALYVEDCLEKLGTLGETNELALPFCCSMRDCILSKFTISKIFEGHDKLLSGDIICTLVNGDPNKLAGYRNETLFEALKKSIKKKGQRVRKKNAPGSKVVTSVEDPQFVATGSEDVTSMEEKSSEGTKKAPGSGSEDVTSMEEKSSEGTKKAPGSGSEDVTSMEEKSSEGTKKAPGSGFDVTSAEEKSSEGTKKAPGSGSVTPGSGSDVTSAEEKGSEGTKKAPGSGSVVTSVEEKGSEGTKKAPGSGSVTSAEEKGSEGTKKAPGSGSVVTSAEEKSLQSLPLSESKILEELKKMSKHYEEESAKKDKDIASILEKLNRLPTKIGLEKHVGELKKLSLESLDESSKNKQDITSILEKLEMMPTENDLENHIEGLEKLSKKSLDESAKNKKDINRIFEKLHRMATKDDLNQNKQDITRLSEKLQRITKVDLEKHVEELKKLSKNSLDESAKNMKDITSILEELQRMPNLENEVEELKKAIARILEILLYMPTQDDVHNSAIVVQSLILEKLAEMEMKALNVNGVLGDIVKQLSDRNFAPF